MMKFNPGVVINLESGRETARGVSMKKIKYESPEAFKRRILSQAGHVRATIKRSFRHLDKMGDRINPLSHGYLSFPRSFGATSGILKWLLDTEHEVTKIMVCIGEDAAREARYRLNEWGYDSQPGPRNDFYIVTQEQLFWGLRGFPMNDRVMVVFDGMTGRNGNPLEFGYNQFWWKQFHKEMSFIIMESK